MQIVQYAINFKYFFKICLLDFEEGEFVKYLYCFHLFHSECIDMWFAKHSNCPGLNIINNNLYLVCKKSQD